jgi:hypothetical protein
MFSLSQILRVAESPPLTTKAEWTSVLRLSHKWRFASMHALAVQRLSALTTPVDRVVLGKRYGAGHWLKPAYQAICEREEWLSESEGERLGLQDVLKIGHARQLVRGPGVLKQPAEERSALLDSMFEAPCTELPAGQSLAPLVEISVPAPPETPVSPQMGSVLDQEGTADAAVASLDTGPAKTDDRNTRRKLGPFYAPITSALQSKLRTVLTRVDDCERPFSDARDHVAAQEQVLKDAQQSHDPNDWFAKMMLGEANTDLAAAREQLHIVEEDLKQAHISVLRLLIPDIEQRGLVHVFETTSEMRKVIRALLLEVTQTEHTHKIRCTTASQAEQHAKYQDLYADQQLRRWRDCQTAENTQAWSSAKQDSDLATAHAANMLRLAQDAEAEHAFVHMKLARLLSELATTAVACQEPHTS